LERWQKAPIAFSARAQTAIRAGDFAAADSILADTVRRGSGPARGGALWWLTISLRNQGRFRENLRAAEEARELASPPHGRGPSLEAVAMAQALFEVGLFRESAALFDSIANTPIIYTRVATRAARHRSWQLTHAATALAAAGDTAKVAALADTIQALGARSAYGRDQRLHHYVRGLLFAARGRLEEAAREYRLAIFSPTSGYTRANLELGRTLLALSRPREAVAVLRPALHGPLESNNYYVTHTELHELLARAFDAAGEPDSAAVHARYVARAWSRADLELSSRLAAVRRLAALGRGEAVRSRR
jgi:tetratricopeptide (TPR) repeat protein